MHEAKVWDTLMRCCYRFLEETPAATIPVQFAYIQAATLLSNRDNHDGKSKQLNKETHKDDWRSKAEDETDEQRNEEGRRVCETSRAASKEMDR